MTSPDWDLKLLLPGKQTEAQAGGGGGGEAGAGLCPRAQGPRDKSAGLTLLHQHLKACLSPQGFPAQPAAGSGLASSYLPRVPER